MICIGDKIIVICKENEHYNLKGIVIDTYHSWTFTDYKVKLDNGNIIYFTNSTEDTEVELQKN